MTSKFIRLQRLVVVACLVGLLSFCSEGRSQTGTTGGVINANTTNGKSAQEAAGENPLQHCRNQSSACDSHGAVGEKDDGNND